MVCLGGGGGVGWVGVVYLCVGANVCVHVYAYMWLPKDNPWYFSLDVVHLGFSFCFLSCGFLFLFCLEMGSRSLAWNSPEAGLAGQ